MSDQMVLINFFTPVGRVASSWRLPGSRAEDLYGLGLPADLARMAEDARLHALFFADTLSFDRTGPNPDLTAYEPVTLMASLAAVTKHIGLIGTASTTFNPPFTLARMLNAIDHLSGGRAGWNIVTSGTGEENYDRDLPERAQRYAIADEYVRLCKALWDCWSDDAVIVDRERGVWADTSRIRKVAEHGENFSAEGPFLMPRSPQGWPLMVQAGQSEEGKEFAARHAELVFTAKSELGLAQEFYASLKGKVEAAGRARSDLKICPGIIPVIADTDAEAEELAYEMSNLINPEVEIPELEHALGDIKLDDIDLDDVVPLERLDAAEEKSSRFENFRRLVAEENYTLRQLLAFRNRSGGHGTITGSVNTVADHLEKWFRSEACDGFAIAPSYIPQGFHDVCYKLVPELQNRGLFRTEYVEGTLRDNLGLARPENIFQN